MKVEELRNYGKGFVDLMSDPELMKRGRKLMMRDVCRQQKWA